MWEWSPADHAFSSWLFLRAIAAVYLVAFLSLGVQVIGLAGRDGIVPVALTFETRPSLRRILARPTLLWLSASDAMLRGLCIAGGLAAVLAFAGIAVAPALAIAWVCYLSLLHGLDEFLSYQWDVLLLETGLAAVFLAPLSFTSTWSPPLPSAAPLLWLYFILFRLMFGSGWVKLRSGDSNWLKLTALRYHYETQPLPNRIAWWAHQLPLPIQRASCAIMFAIELGAPFLILGPAPLPAIGAASIAALMVLIALTGSYGFFNLLGLALCIPLLDDGLFRPWIDPQAQHSTHWPHALTIVIASAASLLGLRKLVQQIYPPAIRRLPRIVERITELVAPFCIANAYGLFTVMTTSRPTVVIEGSEDGETWHRYETRFAPGDPRDPPRQAAPHQPRLDWQLWFYALRGFHRSLTLQLLLARVLAGSPKVRALFAHDPFPDEPPRYVRVSLFDYRFTDAKTRRRTGQWWRSERIGSFSPVLTLGPRSGLSSSP